MGKMVGNWGQRKGVRVVPLQYRRYRKGFLGGTMYARERGSIKGGSGFLRQGDMKRGCNRIAGKARE